MGYFFNLVKRIDRLLLALPILFAFISIAMIASITYDGANMLNRSIVVQAASYLMGYVAIAAVLPVDYQLFARYEKPIYICALLFQLGVYTPLGTDMGTGSLAWLDFGITTMQPSELVRILFVLIFAKFLSGIRDSLASVKGVFFSVLYAAPFLALIMKQDFGSGLVLAVMCVGMVFYAGINGKLFGRLSAAFLVALPILYRFMKGYQKERIEGFLHPENLSIRTTWQVHQAKVAIGSGGLFGKGLFSGTQKELNFIPVQESDFIFAVMVEELGFIGGVALIFLYLVFLLRLWRIGGGAKDLYGSLIAIGIVTMFAFQIFENIGMNMGLMPVTGIPLPFVSSGGTAVAANMLAIGLVLNVGIRNKTINF